MHFAEVNTIAVIAAAVAGVAVGAVWYTALGKPWMAAQDKSREDFTSSPGQFITAGISNLIMAYILAAIIDHIGEVTIASGVVIAALVWLGFVITTLAVNHAFQGSKIALTVIDGGHWLAVLLAMGIVIGAFGI